jgi:hypothetical protein
VIAGVSFYFGEFNLSFLQNQEFLKIMMAALFLTTPASIFIKLLCHPGHLLRMVPTQFKPNLYQVPENISEF